MIVAVRAVRDRRRPLVWWSLGIVGLVLFTVALFPSVRGEESFDELADQLPEAMRSLFGIDADIPLTSPAGYLHGRLFGSLLPLLLLVFGIGAGTRAIAGSEESGALELLLAQPVTRTAVLAQRYGAMVAMLAGLTLMFLAALAGLGPLFGALEGVPATGLAGATGGVFALSLLHATVAFAAGAATGRRAVALASAATLAVAGYLVQGLSGVSDVVHPLRFVNPWHWYLGRNMLARGVAPDALVLPVAVSVVLVGVAAVAFRRRDLR